ncbi:GIY-YIG nuclease family protein [Zobellia galactanivorans]|uniref:GIY-YIG nuclease family protein n=1 Tax=Zobellia galactanivorans (strain DSM 12802 / CCUG 47099 / CIP 106680 / NCIMB 13871 / Dsij) TaxID=63186 RepID=UPI00349F97C7
MKGWIYILECADGSYYTGSTNNLDLRLQQHQNGEGANHTKKRLPVKLVYFEEFQRIDEAFYREKQVQGWSRKKKEALINGFHEKLPELSLAYRDLKTVASRTSATVLRASATILRTSATDADVRDSAADTDSRAGMLSLPKCSAADSKVNPLPEVKPLPEALEGNTNKLKS